MVFSSQFPCLRTWSLTRVAPLFENMVSDSYGSLVWEHGLYLAWVPVYEHGLWLAWFLAPFLSFQWIYNYTLMGWSESHKSMNIHRNLNFFSLFATFFYQGFHKYLFSLRTQLKISSLFSRQLSLLFLKDCLFNLSRFRLGRRATLALTAPGSARPCPAPARSG